MKCSSCINSGLCGLERNNPLCFDFKKDCPEYKESSNEHLIKRVQEVSDTLFNQVKGMMLEHDMDFINPTFDDIFDMALEVKKRMSDCSMNVREAFFDIMY